MPPAYHISMSKHAVSGPLWSQRQVAGQYTRRCITSLALRVFDRTSGQFTIMGDDRALACSAWVLPALSVLQGVLQRAAAKAVAAGSSCFADEKQGAQWQGKQGSPEVRSPAKQIQTSSIYAAL